MNYQTVLKSLVAILFFAGLSSQAQTVKLGYVDGANVFSQLPEVKKASSDLEAYGKQLQKSIKDQNDNLAKRYEEYQKATAAGTITPAMKDATEKELNAMNEKVQIMQQDAQQQMQKKQEEMMKPVEEKIQKAIREVAKENNFTHVFNKEVLLYSLDTDNITNLVLKKLGVTPGAIVTPTPTVPKTTVTPTPKK